MKKFLFALLMLIPGMVVAAPTNTMTYTFTPTYTNTPTGTNTPAGGTHTFTITRTHTFTPTYTMTRTPVPTPNSTGDAGLNREITQQKVLNAVNAQATAGVAGGATPNSTVVANAPFQLTQISNQRAVATQIAAGFIATATPNPTQFAAMIATQITDQKALATQVASGFIATATPQPTPALASFQQAQLTPAHGTNNSLLAPTPTVGVNAYGLMDKNPGGTVSWYPYSEGHCFNCIAGNIQSNSLTPVVVTGMSATPTFQKQYDIDNMQFTNPSAAAVSVILWAGTTIFWGPQVIPATSGMVVKGPIPVPTNVQGVGVAAGPVGTPYAITADVTLRQKP